MRYNSFKIYIPLMGLVFITFGCGQSAKQPDAQDRTDSAGFASEQRDTSSTTNGRGQLPSSTRDGNRQTGRDVASFVLPGYSILDTATGDLNRDAFADKLLLLKKQGEDTSSDVTDHPEKRPLLILTGQSDGTYQLAARNDDAVLCVDCGGVMGDPYMRLVIKDGYFSVELAGGSSWRWTRTVTFKYAPNDHEWFLYKDGHGNFHASEPGKVETKMYTAKDFGQVAFAKFDVYKDQ